MLEEKKRIQFIFKDKDMNLRKDLLLVILKRGQSYSQFLKLRQRAILRGSLIYVYPASQLLNSIWGGKNVILTSRVIMSDRLGRKTSSQEPRASFVQMLNSSDGFENHNHAREEIAMRNYGAPFMWTLKATLSCLWPVYSKWLGRYEIRWWTTTLS